MKKLKHKINGINGHVLQKNGIGLLKFVRTILQLGHLNLVHLKHQKYFSAKHFFEQKIHKEYDVLLPQKKW